MKRILVTTDFSPLSWKALPVAALIAKFFADERPSITLAVVEDQSFISSDSAPWASEESPKDRLEYLRLKFLSDFPSNISLLTKNGGVPEAITEHAKNTNTEMIVLASHGRSGLKRLLAGSVAERVVAYAPCPVLVVPAAEDVPEPSDVYRILVTTDLSEESEAAFSTARELYNACGSDCARMTILHVVENMTRATFGVSLGSSQENIYRDLESAARAQLTDMSAKHFPGLPVMTAVVRSALPRIPALLEYIGSHNADLIVSARHGSSGLEHALFGSFTRALISSSHRNVLIVPVQ